MTTGTYVEVIEAVQRDAVDSMSSLFGAEPGARVALMRESHCRQTPQNE